METAPPRYRKWNLPAFESGASDSKPLLEQAWVDALPGLGFEPVFDQVFCDLDSQLSHLNETQMGRPWRYKPQQLWIQVWRHEAGALSSIVRFRSDESKDWINSRADLVAMESHGFSAAYSHSRCLVAIDGSAIAFIESELPGAKWKDVWQKIREVAAQGRLVPLDQFTELTLPSNTLESIVLDWGIPQDFAGKIDTPAARYSAKAEIICERVGPIMRAWVDRIGQLPDCVSEAERGLWLDHMKLCMERLFRNSSYSPAAHPLPDPAAQAWVDEIDSRIQQHPATYHLETLTRKVQARLVAMLQVGGMVEGDSLEPEERVATEAWLGAITSSEEESAHTCARAEQMDIPRFCLQFKDFLFACAREPGVASKIKTWIQSHPDEDLVEACTVPDVDGMTLPLHLSRAWMQAVNARHCQEEQDHRIGVVRQCFDLLSQVCPIEEWVWATNKASAWSWATGQAINLPMDEDLVGPHQARLTEFFNWAQQAGARIPAVTFIPGHPGPVSLLDSEALARAMEQAVSGEQFNSIGEAGLRIDLMAPLIGRLCQADMQAGVVGAEPRREGRPGRRL